MHETDIHRRRISVKEYIAYINPGINATVTIAVGKTFRAEFAAIPIQIGIIKGIPMFNPLVPIRFH